MKKTAFVAIVFALLSSVLWIKTADAETKPATEKTAVAAKVKVKPDAAPVPKAENPANKDRMMWKGFGHDPYNTLPIGSDEAKERDRKGLALKGYTKAQIDYLVDKHHNTDPLVRYRARKPIKVRRGDVVYSMLFGKKNPKVVAEVEVDFDEADGWEYILPDGKRAYWFECGNWTDMPPIPKVEKPAPKAPPAPPGKVRIPPIEPLGVEGYCSVTTTDVGVVGFKNTKDDQKGFSVYGKYRKPLKSFNVADDVDMSLGVNGYAQMTEYKAKKYEGKQYFFGAGPSVQFCGQGWNLFADGFVGPMKNRGSEGRCYRSEQSNLILGTDLNLVINKRRIDGHKWFPEFEFWGRYLTSIGKQDHNHYWGGRKLAPKPYNPGIMEAVAKFGIVDIPVTDVITLTPYLGVGARREFGNSRTLAIGEAGVKVYAHGHNVATATVGFWGQTKFAQLNISPKPIVQAIKASMIREAGPNDTKPVPTVQAENDAPKASYPCSRGFIDEKDQFRPEYLGCG